MQSQIDYVQRYLDWLELETKIRETHQSHKEKVAWTATALFLSTMVVLGYRLEPEIMTSFEKAGICLFIVLLSLCTFVFLAAQFMTRWEDVELSVACKNARLEIIEDPHTAISRHKGAGNTSSKIIENQDEITRHSLIQTYPDIVMSKIGKKWELANPWDWFKFFDSHEQISTRRILESVSYSLILIPSVGLLIYILIV